MPRTIILAFMILLAAAVIAQDAASSGQAAVDQTAASSDQSAANADQAAQAPAAATPAANADQESPPTASAQPATSADQAAPRANSEQAATEQPAPAATQPAAAPEQAAPAAEQPAAGAENTPTDAIAQVAQLSAKLEEANTTIDQLTKESDDLKAKADDADQRAQAARDEADKANAAAADAVAKAQAVSDAAQAQLKAAQDAAAASSVRADALALDADKLKAQIADLQSRIAELETRRESLNGKLASFGDLRIDLGAFPELLVSGFADGTTRLGNWKLSSGVLSQTDKSQFFSRLTFPLVQSEKPVLYSLETKTGAKGWVGTGIHFFAEGIKKPKGYGEGSSLLVWLTRDAKARGNDGTYLQVYRSDNDVSMERVLDAKIKERLDGWNRIDVLYEPSNEFIVISVNGSVRAAYRTYFGIGKGVSMSLRTLGEGVQFRNLEVRR